MYNRSEAHTEQAHALHEPLQTMPGIPHALHEPMQTTQRHLMHCMSLFRRGELHKF